MKKDHLLKELSVADYITLAATLLIIVALWLLWREETYLAVSVAFLSMFLDYLDGTVARKYGGSGYGKVLDSLYDILGFVLFPSLVVITQTNWAWWSLVVVAVYHLSASLRLARFTNEGYFAKDKRYYVGSPVLFSKYALILSFVAGAKLSVLILAVMVPLMVSSKLVKKPHPTFAQLNLIYAGIFLMLYLK
jgi:CDP-diacylglycerol---serine O-phosphatidyltransferase